MGTKRRGAQIMGEKLDSKAMDGQLSPEDTRLRSASQQAAESVDFRYSEETLR